MNYKITKKTFFDSVPLKGYVQEIKKKKKSIVGISSD